MIRKDKRSSFNGKLGQELDEMWAAITANQIISHGGMTVLESSGGVILKPKAEGGGGASEDSSIIQTTVGEKFDGQQYTHTMNTSWFTDPEYRVIAVPPLSPKVVDSMYHYVVGSDDNLFFDEVYESNGQSDMIWPFEEFQYHRNSTNPQHHWGLFYGWLYGAKTIIVKLDDPIAVPCEPDITVPINQGGNGMYERFYSEYAGTGVSLAKRLGTPYWNSCHLIWASYIELNISGREWASHKADMHRHLYFG